MKSAKLTQEFVDAAAPRKREYIIVDDRSDGLALRVRPNGSKTWQLRWREDGALRRISLGSAKTITLAVARKRAADARWMEELEAPPDPKKRVLFCDLAIGFLNLKTAEGKQTKSMRIYIQSQLIPAMGHVPAAMLSTPQIAAWFHQYSATRPGGANETLRTLAAILGYGRETGLIPADTPDPCAPIRRNPRRNMGRILSADGLAALGRALRRPARGEEDICDLISLILLTGCRSGEIRRLRWDEVRHDRLALKKAKTGPRDVLLAAAAKRILKRRKKTETGLYVFPSPKTVSKPRSSIWGVWREIKARAGIDPAFRLHDLRHSYASHAIMSGETLAMTGKLLGHASPVSTERYAHYDGAFLAAAANRVSAHIAEAMA